MSIAVFCKQLKGIMISKIFELYQTEDNKAYNQLTQQYTESSNYRSKKEEFIVSCLNKNIFAIVLFHSTHEFIQEFAIFLQ